MTSKSLTTLVLLVVGLLMVTLVPLRVKAAPTFSGIVWTPEFPQSGDLIDVRARVEDPIGVMTVTLFYCAIPSGICRLFAMYDPDFDYVYNNDTVDVYPGAIGADFYITAENASGGSNTSETYYVQYALSINVTLSTDLTQAQAFPGQKFNITVNALYWGNASAPTRYSEVNITCLESSEYWTGTTDFDGNFTKELQAPATVGGYTYNVTVANRTLEGYKKTTLRVMVEPLPELEVEGINVTYPQSTPFVGDNVTANVTVVNLGTLPATFRVLVTLEGGGPAITLLNESYDLNPDNKTSIEVWWTAREGKQWLNVTVDPGNFVREVDENNNFASKSVTASVRPGGGGDSSLILYAIAAIVILAIVVAVVLLARGRKGKAPKE